MSGVQEGLVPITLQTDEGPRERPAIVRDSGLAVHEIEPEPFVCHHSPPVTVHRIIYRWGVTHVATGLSVLKATTFEAAMGACQKLEAITDWTFADVNALPESVPEQVEDVRRGVWFEECRRYKSDAEGE